MSVVSQPNNVQGLVCMDNYVVSFVLLCASRMISSLIVMHSIHVRCTPYYKHHYPPALNYFCCSGAMITFVSFFRQGLFSKKIRSVGCWLLGVIYFGSIWIPLSFFIILLLLSSKREFFVRLQAPPFIHSAFAGLTGNQGEIHAKGQRIIKETHECHCVTA